MSPLSAPGNGGPDDRRRGASEGEGEKGAGIAMLSPWNSKSREIAQDINLTFK